MGADTAARRPTPGPTRGRAGWWLLGGGLGLAALLLRLGVAATATLWFDEATVGLMARHVLEGRLPVYFYGQTFMGAAEAYLHAVPFAILGASPDTLRVWPVLVTLLHGGLAALLAHRVFGRAGPAAVLALLPSPFLLKWAHDARLHYDLLLVFTPLCVLLALRACRPGHDTAGRTRALLVLAVVVGLAWWINLLAAAILGALGLGLLWERPRLRRAALGAPLGVLLGSAPVWLFTLASRWPLGETPWVTTAAEAGRHLHALVVRAGPILLGVPHQVSVPWPIAVGLMTLALGAVALALGDPHASPIGRRLLGLVTILTLLAPLVTRHGANLASNDPRYLLPVLALWPVLMGGALARLGRTRRAATALGTTGLVGLHMAAIWIGHPALRSREAWQAKRNATAAVAQLGDQLADRGLTDLYTHAPDVLTFASGERVAVSHFYLESQPWLARRVDGAARVGYLGPAPAGFEAALEAAGIRFRRQPTVLGPLLTRFALDAPVLREVPPRGWGATAWPDPERARHAIDREGRTAWSSRRPRRTGMWFAVDLGRLHEIALVAWLPGGYQEVPSGFRLETSPDGVRWHPAAEAVPYYGPLYWSAGRPMGRVRWGRVEVRFEPRPARHLRITHEGDEARHHWSIRELAVYEAVTPGPAAGARRPPVPGAAAAHLRAAGVRRVYADHGVGAQLAAASGGAIETLPASVRVDPYGAEPDLDALPPFRAGADAAIAVPAGPTVGPAIEAALHAAGLRFAATDVEGYRLLTSVAPAPEPAPARASAGVSVTGSVAAADPAAVLDGRRDTRWSTGRPQRSGEWLRVDFSSPVALAGVALDQGSALLDYPRGLRVEIAGPDGQWEERPAEFRWIGPLAWTGTHLLRLGVARVVVAWPPTRAGALRLTQTGADPVYDWSVAELRWLEP